MKRIHRRIRTERTGSASAWIALLVGLVLGVMSGLSVVPTASSRHSVAPPGASATASGCAPSGIRSPDSLLIPTAGPRASLAAGSSVRASYQAQLLTAPPGNRASLFVPSVQASFPTTTGGRVQIYLHPAWLPITGTGWSKSVTASTKISSAVGFPHGNATLSTAWLAVMANTTYGGYQVQFRWMWATTNATGGTTKSPWSGAVNASTSSQQPTRFFPAPYVGVVSTTPLTGAAGGSTFTANLSGNVSSTFFRILTESGTGHELNSVCRTTAAGLTTFNASIPLDYANGTALPSGSYIVHIHNEGGAIVVFKQVRVR
ncbi:MAG: hypothetical protein L3K15_07025 [Thermoplasmata archaeon]|nr:hypothetical protein [Thermoplasmata archaeon]